MHAAFLGNYLIGLREGLEATLVVTILVAFLVKSHRRNVLPQVWLGVVAAVVLSIGFGAVLEFVAEGLLGYHGQELFEAIASLLAVVFVTWMIFWMRRFARMLAADLRGKLEQAIGMGAFAVVIMAFLAVVREGLETALLFYAAAQGASATAGPLVGLFAGVVTAVALGWLMYLGAIRINLSVFFTCTGVLLILVAAGILKYSVHDFQEAGVLPGLNAYAFDISASYDPSSWYAAVLGGMLNFTATPSLLEVIIWVGYAVIVLALFVGPIVRRWLHVTASPPPVAEPSASSGTTARAMSETASEVGSSGASR